jgi:hypothetical protein
MEGMTIQQYAEIVQFTQKHHHFGRWDDNNDYPKIGENGKSIKYIDNIYDSRDAKVWSISFRGFSENVRFQTNHFGLLNPKPKGWKYDSLYELCMAYLKCEFEPKEEFLFLNPK